MPRYPAAVARLFEARGIRSAVVRIEDLSPRFRRVHLAGEGLRGHPWEPCQVVSFRVTPTEFRHYTPDAFDAAAGRMSILFYRHCAGLAGLPAAGLPARSAGLSAGSQGVAAGSAGLPARSAGLPPGEDWLVRLAVGDPVVVLGPGAARGFRARTAPGTVLVCGDATTIGLWHSMAGWAGAGHRLRGVVEVPSPDVTLARELVPGVDVVAQAGPPGTALLARLGDVVPGALAHAYLAGHGQTIQSVRELLRTRHGLHRSAISTQPYWATGKAGL